MKAYIINIELIDSDPLIWRKVILPAGATFNRLNDVIQNVTNFQSGYPYEPYLYLSIEKWSTFQFKKGPLFLSF